MKIPLIGGEYSPQSPASQAETCINLYPELVDGVTARRSLDPNQNGKSPGALYPTPGRASFKALTSGTIRAMFSVSGRVWVVNNGSLIELNSAGTVVTTRTGLTDDGKPALIMYNGHQVCVISGGSVYIDNGTSMVSQRFLSFQGTVNTLILSGRVSTSSSGFTIRYISGDPFIPGTAWVGQTIFINLVVFTVATVPDQYTMTVTADPGTNANQPYSTDSPASVQWVSGDKFITDGSWVGQTITINSIACTILAVLSDQYLVALNVTPPATGVPYSYPGDLVTATWGCFLDGYFIIQRPSSRQFNISGLNDGTSWDQLDFALKESYPDNIVSMIAANEQLYIWGSESLEVWQNTGGTTANPFPFSRIPGSVSRFGAASTWTQVALDGNVYFMGGDGSGGVSVYVLNGWSPVVISTMSAGQLFAPQTRAIAWGYQIENHSFLVVSNSGTGITSVYDQNTGIWHQRSIWNGSAFAFNATEFHCFAYSQDGSWGAGVHLVGSGATSSAANGTVYQLTGATDVLCSGGVMEWQRTLPYIYSENKRIIFGRFTLELQTGSVSGSAPTITLSWSDDRGQTFKGNLTAAIGLPTAYAARVYWTRTGLSRGRIFRLQGAVNPSYPVALIDAECDLAVCS